MSNYRAVGATGKRSVLKGMASKFVDYVGRHHNDVLLRDIAIAKGWRWPSLLKVLEGLEADGLATREVRHGHCWVMLTDLGLERAAEVADREYDRRSGKRVRV